LESWMDDVEAQLSSEDHGKDIIGVSNLLKKHQVLVRNLSRHTDHTHVYVFWKDHLTLSVL